jgi:hypothetical protein
MCGSTGLFETLARIVELGGTPELSAHVAAMRGHFEARTGRFAPDDPWFEERSRAFWSDAVTRGNFGHSVEAHLSSEQAAWLAPLDRAHRGLFRIEGDCLVDVWCGVEFTPTLVDELSQAELSAANGQFFDGRVVGSDNPFLIALLPGSLFHPTEASDAITNVLAAARTVSLPTHDTLDALLRMERTLRSLSRVKPAYAYRADALTPSPTGSMLRRHTKGLG